MTNNESLTKLTQILTTAVADRTLRKLILSRPDDKTAQKTVGALFEKNGDVMLQLETFMRDGKALHENLAADVAVERILALCETHRQLDILTTSGTCTVMRSKKGQYHVADKIKSDVAAPTADIRSHDREKSHILSGSENFLVGLGISSEEVDRFGERRVRVVDRMRAKYRQINRFLEILGDVYAELPRDGTLRVYDLCCGKSYLTFAVYHYLTEVMGREVEMLGVDLKPDVIEYCSKLSEKLGFSGLRFECGNVAELTVDEPPALVVSLHACDIATDFVLSAAVKYGARVILSTPCCHHEMMNQLDSKELGFIKHSILRQKLCDAATDSLRGLRLEIEGYEVNALELVDPEETPKNVILRCVKRGISAERAKSLREEYDAAVKLLGVAPMLDKLIK